MANKLLSGVIAMHPAVAAGLAGGTARKREESMQKGRVLGLEASYSF